MNDPRRTYAWQQLRAQWAMRMEVGEPITCRLCSQPILPGQPWDLGHGIPHAQGGQGHDAQPEHTHCNRSAGGKLRATTHPGRRIPPSPRWTR